MDLLDLLLLLVLNMYTYGKELDRFYRDEQGEVGKVCKESDRVVKQTSGDVIKCLVSCSLNNECASLFYMIGDQTCCGCNRDLHSTDMSLVDTGSQTMYFVKGWQLSLTCSDILTERPDMTSGRYFNMYGMEIYCDMETDGGGWTIFQMRFENSTDFERNWKDYSQGFGNVNGGDFWLGLYKLAMIVNIINKPFEFRVDLADSGGNTAYALYQHFDLDGENENYIIYGGNYSGTAGDSLFNSTGVYINGQKFATKDKDTGDNCSKRWQGGWWFKGCCDAMLNGPFDGGFGLFWHSWRSPEPIIMTSMKIREK